MVTWGSKDNGGDLSSRKEGLSGVKKIYSTSRAFAAVLWDETVVTWGHEGCGGNSFQHVCDECCNRTPWSSNVR